MKNLRAKVLTAGLTAAMVLSMGSPVFAAPQTVDGVNAVSTDESAKISKTLEMAKKGVTNPGFTFTFDFSPVTAVKRANKTDADKTEYVLDITKTAGTKQSQTVTLSNVTSNNTSAIFSSSEFSEAGVYGYIVTESATAKIGDEEFKGDADHILTLDQTKYLVRIKVVSDEGTLKIAGISAQAANVTTEGSTTTITPTGEKIDGGTDEGGTKGTIPFTNKYTEYANDDPTDPDPKSGDDDNSDKGLVISKKITGEGANTNDQFVYKIEFTADSVNAGLTTSVTNNVKVYSDEACNTEVTSLKDSGTYYFKLGNNQEIDFKVPAGTAYTVTETNGDYTVKTTGYDNGTARSEGTTAAVSGTAGEYINTVAYTNDKSGTPLTGIVNNYGSLIAVVAIAAGGMVILTLRRRRDA